MNVVEKYIFYIFPLLLMRLFGFVNIPDGIKNGINYLGVILIIIFTYNMLFNDSYHKIRNFMIMKFILFSVIFSILMSAIFWNQDIFRGFNVTSTLLGMFYYLFLIKARPSSEDIKRLIYIYTFVYIFLWIYAFIKAPELVFNVANSNGELDEARGIFRLNIVGRQFLVMCFFLCLNQWVIYKQKIHIAFSIICFIFIIFQVTRQVIVFSFVIGLIYFLLNYKNRIVLLIGLLFSFLLIGNITFNDDSVIGNMINLSESQVQNNASDEDIRVNAISFFINDFPNNIVTVIFGNGVHFNKGEYGLYLTKINNIYGFYLSDVGYINMYITCGIIGLVLYLLLFIKISVNRVNRKFFYGKLFIIYMIFANIGADWYAKADGVVLICIAVYIVSKKGDPLTNKLKYSVTNPIT